MHNSNVATLALVLATIVAGTGCSDLDSTHTVTAPQFTVAGQQVTVSPSSLEFSGTSAPSQWVSASTNFAGAISAGVDNSNVCSVTPGSGTNKIARYEVRGVGSGSCTITFTDKKGGTASVRVSVANEQDLCGVTLSSQSAAYSGAAVSSVFSVSNPAGCAWTAQTATPWISVVGSSSDGSSVVYSLQENLSGLPREGSITVHVPNGQSRTFTITQAG